jgi:hypothetical protein
MIISSLVLLTPQTLATYTLDQQARYIRLDLSLQGSQDATNV